MPVLIHIVSNITLGLREAKIWIGRLLQLSPGEVWEKGTPMQDD